MGDSEPVGSHELGTPRLTTLWWLIWILWIPFFVPVIATFLKSHPAPARAIFSLGGVAVFFAVYLWTTRRSAGRLAGADVHMPRDVWARWAPVALMLALSVILTRWNGSDWGTLFIFSCTSAAGWLPLWESMGVIAGAVAYEGLGLGLRGDMPGAVNAIAFTLIPAVIVLALMRSVLSAQQVRAAREEIARVAAVTEERLRIARDLHDLLGHNLSVIALKSELARRLVGVAPERAAVEIGDVETVARNALREVREAVAGYRQPTLATELVGVREVLASAGIACRQEGDSVVTAGLPTGADAALAWVLREGVTNVVRHGWARTCTIRVQRGPDEVVLEVLNDSRRVPLPTTDATAHGATGQGLRGAAERMEALGGRCEAGPDGEGFRLYASLPIGQGPRMRGGALLSATPSGAERVRSTPLMPAATNQRAQEEAQG